jgi:pimeloyl-ACP methyl ester carboxylesterase
MIDFQRHWIFPAHAVAVAGPLPSGGERLDIETPDGERLAGVYLQPSHDNEDRTLVLGFGGNAWNGQDVASYLHQIFPDAHVVVFFYRGYAPSTGAPSAESLIADAPLVFDAAFEKVKPAHVVAAGFSIGSGIAATLASRRPLDGLILVTPFDSLKAVAQDAFPWLPVAAFFSHEIDAADAISSLDTPVAIFAAERDEIVPAARTDALRKRVRNLVVDETIAGADHNSIYGRSRFQLEMAAALKRLIS